MTTGELINRLEVLIDGPPEEVVSAGAPTPVVEEARDLARAAGALDAEGRPVSAEVIDHLERRALRLSRALARRTPQQAAALSRTLDIIRAFRDVALPALGEEEADVLGECEGEALWARRLTRRDDAALPELDDLGSRIDDTVNERLAEHALDPRALDRPGFLLARMITAEIDLQHRGHVDAAADLRRIRGDFWQRIRERGSSLEPEERPDWLRELTDDVNDKGEDAMAQAESLDSQTGLRLLEIALRDVGRAQKLTRALNEKVRRRELRRMRRRIAAATQDKEVRIRQLAQVGARGLRIIDATIFAFIIAVIGILGWEIFGSPSDRTRLWLSIVDALMCAAFITEFTWRLVLARRRWTYFRRYLLIDVIPSIPYGLFTEILHLHVAGRPDNARLLRVFRLARLLRGMRLLRPLANAYRLMAFALQGMDRLVRRHADFLNRNVVLFEQDLRPEESEITLHDRLRRLDVRVSRAFRLSVASLEPAAERRAVECRVRSALQRFEEAPRHEVHLRQQGSADLRDLRMESLIQNLLSLEADDVEDRLGEEGAARVARFLGFLDIAVIRSLPILRRVVPGLTRLDPFDAVATAGRRLGRSLDGAMDRMRFFGDLNGIVTGPQLLDRTGATLVKMTQRPAVRLLLIGFFMLLLSGIVDLFGIHEEHWEQTEVLLTPAQIAAIREFPPDDGWTYERYGQIRLEQDSGERVPTAREQRFMAHFPDWSEAVAVESADATRTGGFLYVMYKLFRKILGIPLIVLGSICLLIQGFGRWVRRLAGEASDRFQKVAEAQGINLLKFEKLDHREADLAVLFERVVGPEMALLGERDPEALEAERGRFVQIIPGKAGPTITDAAVGPARDQVMMLYQDYLDGAILHRSNIKTTEQFLGNLDIETIRSGRLLPSRRERKGLAALDITRERPLPTGPYLWFRFITESLAEKTAKLVLEYNRMAVPLRHRHLVDVERIDRMKRWAGREDRRRSLRERNSDLLSGDAYGTTRFNSLHFLTADPERGRQVAMEFGEEVAQRLAHDRRAMVREVFGTYPFEQLPRHRRTLNPYGAYFRWIGGGRILILPLRLLLGFFVWTFRGLRAMVRVVREQMHPEIRRALVTARQAPFSVAIRKLNRMRRPIFMAALSLRSRFDPEYCGAPLPGETLDDDASQLRHDLDLIGAREHEREELRQLSERTAARMRRLEQRLGDRGWPERSLLEVLATVEDQAPALAFGGPDLEESIRAVAVAWSIDYQSCRSLLEARDEVDQAFRRFLNDPGDTVKKRRFLRPSARRLLRDYVERGPFRDEPPETQALIEAAFASNRFQVRTRLKTLAAAGGEEKAEAAAWSTLLAVARYPMPWSRQVVTLRAVQTLTCLDIINSRRAVYSLGGYADEAGARPASGLLVWGSG